MQIQPEEHSLKYCILTYSHDISLMVISQVKLIRKMNLPSNTIKEKKFLKLFKFHSTAICQFS